MPIEVVGSYALELRRLVDKLDEETISNARHDANYRIHFAPAQELPEIANWQAFQARHGIGKRLLAHDK
jgi:hypothetical protein